MPKNSSVTSRAFGSGAKRQSKLKRFMPLLVVAIVGAAGVYTLVRTFASTGLVNGYIYVDGGRFVNQTMTKFEHTKSYGPYGGASDIVFSPSGKSVAFLDYANSTDAAAGIETLYSSASNGTGLKPLYRNPETSGPNYSVVTSVSWSRDSQRILYSTWGESGVAAYVIDKDATGQTLVPISNDFDAEAIHFSGSNPNQIVYIRGNTEICQLDIMASAATPSCHDMTINGQPLDSAPGTYTYLKKMRMSGDIAYLIGLESTNQDGIETTQRENIYKIDSNNGNVTMLTNYAPVATADSGDRRFILSQDISPDGSKLIYQTTTVPFDVTTGAWGSNTEDRVYMMNSDGTGNSLAFDNQNPSVKYEYVGQQIVWQPYEIGSSQPPIPDSVSSNGAIIGSITLPKLVYGQTVTPTINVTNPNLSTRAYTIQAVRLVNGNMSQKSVTISIAPGETKTVNLPTLKVPYAKSSMYTASSNNIYAYITDDKGGYTPTESIYFSLPQPVFTLKAPSSKISVKKGTVITFKGKTLPKKQVQIWNKAVSTPLYVTKSDATGVYSLKYTASSSRTVKVCLKGFETAVKGCHAVDITVK
jgi:hypothetical protein